MAKQKSVETFTHGSAKRVNIPTAEFQSVLSDDERAAIRLAYERRNRDLDPQLVWRGKDEQDWSDLVVDAPPLYIQEKVHPKVLIDDLMQRSAEREAEAEPQIDLFSDFNGFPEEGKTAEFYRHEGNWTNRMILGDSLQVMASLAEREGLRGKVQCIYLDPPYGIKFNSNFQWSTTTRDVKDNKSDHITREPEQVKAFRDTWRDGIHSYLTYLRDRLTVARDLLSDTGSIFVQIGDENVHRVRALMDEVFGEGNSIETVSFRKKTMPLGGRFLEGICDYVLWYARNKLAAKYRPLYLGQDVQGDSHWNIGVFRNGPTRQLSRDEIDNHSLFNKDADVAQLISLYPAGSFATGIYEYVFEGRRHSPPTGRSWKSPIDGMNRLFQADRLWPYAGGKTLRYLLRLSDYPVTPLSNMWTDTSAPPNMRYVVETNERVVQRCILMTTDPGDLVLDPTCGSGTTAYVAEQWGRRWITIDTSRVALALARARLMGARYSYYLLADSPDGRLKEAEVTGGAPPQSPTYGDIRRGFVYERVPHITLKAIANNTEIDVLYEEHQPAVERALGKLNAALKGYEDPFTVQTGGRSGKTVDFTAPEGETVPLPSDESAPANALLEWEVPREAPEGWPEAATRALAEFWNARIARQKAIDASIERKAEQEFLYDKPYVDKKRVRVAGPFTVESLSPHRVLAIDEDDELVHADVAAETEPPYGERRDDEPEFATVVIENLRKAGVQQPDKKDKIDFTTITGWPGELIGAEARYSEGENKAERRAGVFIGPEFGTVSKPDLVAAAREAADAGFNVLIACAFNYDAQSTEFSKLGRIPILKARMNADLHMADELANTGAGNLFVIFGEPDIEILDRDQPEIRVKINGVDVFHPQSGTVRSSGPEGIAGWFIDTDYNEESFFIRHAYFLGAGDPYKSLKTTLKSEIDRDAWDSLYSDTSRPFPKPSSGRIAVKVINHLGDEVMKVFRLS